MPSKLGFHIQRRRHGWPSVIAETTPALVKSLEWSIVDEWVPEEQTEPDRLERATRWTEARTFLLGRHRSLAQHLDDPIARAGEFWRQMLHELSGGNSEAERSILDRMRYFDAWEGYNEIGTGPDIEALGRFDAALAHQFHGEGIRYACGGFSTGNPSLEDWPRYCAALLDEVASGRGDLPDLLHVHEYWFPDHEWDELFERAGPLDVDRMREATKGSMLRWRLLYEHADTPQELRLPVIVSECGWDMGHPQVGFRRSYRTDEDYFRWLVWYDQELQRPLDGVDYVVGAAVFTYGHEQQWASFEIDRQHGRGVLDLLRRYLADENQAPHPRDWEAASPGHDSAGPYESGHFVLMSPRIGQGWRQALVPYLQAFRATNGQALEDALLPLNKRLHITLVGGTGTAGAVPAEWEGEIHRRAPHIVIDRMAAKTTLDLQRIVDQRIARDDRYGEHDAERPFA